MHRFVSSVVRALADFIEFDAAVELGIKNGALNDLNKQALAEKQRHDMLARYTRIWSIAGRPDEGFALVEAQDEVRERRLDRKRLAAKRRAERELNETLFA